VKQQKVTADTITDEQIRQLGADLGDNFTGLIALALSSLASHCPKCSVEISVHCTDMTRSGYRAIKSPHSERLAKKYSARARCAEIWNARHEGGS